MSLGFGPRVAKGSYNDAYGVRAWKPMKARHFEGLPFILGLSGDDPSTATITEWSDGLAHLTGIPRSAVHGVPLSRLLTASLVGGGNGGAGAGAGGSARDGDVPPERVLNLTRDPERGPTPPPDDDSGAPGSMQSWVEAALIWSTARPPEAAENARYVHFPIPLPLCYPGYHVVVWMLREHAHARKSRVRRMDLTVASGGKVPFVDGIPPITLVGGHFNLNKTPTPGDILMAAGAARSGAAGAKRSGASVGASLAGAGVGASSSAAAAPSWFDKLKRLASDAFGAIENMDKTMTKKRLHTGADEAGLAASRREIGNGVHGMIDISDKSIRELMDLESEAGKLWAPSPPPLVPAPAAAAAAAAAAGGASSSGGVGECGEGGGGSGSRLTVHDVSLNYEEAVRAAAAGCNSAADLPELIARAVGAQACMLAEFRELNGEADHKPGKCFKLNHDYASNPATSALWRRVIQSIGEKYVIVKRTLTPTPPPKKSSATFETSTSQTTTTAAELVVRFKPNHKLADNTNPYDRGYPCFRRVEKASMSVKLPAYGSFMPGYKNDVRDGAWLELRIEHAPNKSSGMFVSKYKGNSHQERLRHSARSRVDVHAWQGCLR